LSSSPSFAELPVVDGHIGEGIQQRSAEWVWLGVKIANKPKPELLHSLVIIEIQITGHEPTSYQVERIELGTPRTSPQTPDRVLPTDTTMGPGLVRRDHLRLLGSTYPGWSVTPDQS
jgi:hypothetical protein